MNDSRKRLRDAGIPKEEIEKWTENEIRLVNSLPGDLFKLIFSKYVTRVIDVENMCRANHLTKDQCVQYKIFQFIFYAKYGKEEWDRLHINPRQVFVNDSWFLRAYELSTYVLNEKADKKKRNLRFKFVNDEIRINIRDVGASKLIDFWFLYSDGIPWFKDVFIFDEFGPQLNWNRDGKQNTYFFDMSTYSINIETSPKLLLAMCAFIYRVIKNGYKVESKRFKFDMNLCINCKVQPQIGVCGGCEKAAYCGQECAQEHYLTHKHKCKK